MLSSTSEQSSLTVSKAQKGYFENSLEHLLAECRRIEMKLQLRVSTDQQRDDTKPHDSLRGLYISEKQVNTILGTTRFAHYDGSGADKDEAVKQFEADIAARKRESLRRGVVLRLNELERSFRLSPLDIDILLLCLLPEIDSRYQLLYAYLQDDVTRKIPTVDLSLQLLCASFEDAIKARSVFNTETNLIRYQLLLMFGANPPRPTPLLARFIQVDDRVAGYLLEADQVDVRLTPFVEALRPKVALRDMVLNEDLKIRMAKLTVTSGDKSPVCYLHGGYGAGKQALAEAVCTELSVPMLKVDVPGMLAAEVPPESLIPLVFREGYLRKAALFFSGFDRLLTDEQRIKPCFTSTVRELETYPHRVFLAAEKDWQPKGVLNNKPFVSIGLGIPPYDLRKKLWQKQSLESSLEINEEDLADLASRFRLNGGQILDVISTAKNLARWRDPENPQVKPLDIFGACRQQLRGNLDSLTRKVQPSYGWDDIILPGDQMEQLHEICGYVEYYHKVYSEWGFERKISTGKGLNALFIGPSGTGKTMAAEIMGAELGLDLYKIDLSLVVSKYIGETEKNLDRIFSEGESSNAILFFDEADALFGKRSEVKDSHDRYANLEIAYLLQKMDDYTGAVILASNLRNNMDEAFARRMHFTVDFPAPEEPDRYRIWSNIFPRETPLSGELDLKFLARQFKITGGNIKNIALAAAFLAAQDGGSITMENLIRATKREYQKIGRLCTETDFAQYFEYIKG